MENEYKKDIDALIAKYFAGEASPQEALDLEEWKTESSQNKKYFDTSAKVFSATFDKVLFQGVDVEGAWKKNRILKEKKLSSKSGTASYLYVIISLLLVMFAAYYWLKSNNSPQKIDATLYAVNEILVDGSIATIEPNSSIIISDEFGEDTRTVKLQGSAEFEVEHDDQIPFVVEVEDIFIEDLGTKFKIMSAPESDTVFVIVEEGVVRVYDAFGSEIILKAGEKAWYVKSKKLIIPGLETEVALLKYEDTLLKDVIDQLSGVFEVNIILDPPALEDCPLTTGFFDQDITSILSIISETLDFQLSSDDTSYTLKGRPCYEVE